MSRVSAALTWDLDLSSNVLAAMATAVTAGNSTISTRPQGRWSATVLALIGTALVGPGLFRRRRDTV